MTQNFTVSDMSCQHCANAITQEVAKLPGVHNVVVDLQQQQVRVDADEQVATEAILASINAAGYTEVTVRN